MTWKEQGALCPQCGSWLNTQAELPTCNHCGWIEGQEIVQLPELIGGSYESDSRRAQA